jgi:hypothetical protein
MNMSVRIPISRSDSPMIHEKEQVVKPAPSNIHASLVIGEITPSK